MRISDWSSDVCSSDLAVKNARLASPHLQGSFFGSYGYDLPSGATGFTSFQVQHVGSFPNGFPNTPGKPGTPSPLTDYTDTYTNINLQTGVRIGRLSTTRSEERRDGTECVSTCRYRWSPSNKK